MSRNFERKKMKLATIFFEKKKMESGPNYLDINDFTIEQENPEDWEYPRIFILNEKATNTKYAAKELNAEIYSTPKNQKVLDRYLISLNQLHHPTILRYRGYSNVSLRDQKKWQPTIVTEFLENRSLQEKFDEIKRGINQQEWTPTKKFIDLIGIVYALKYLHQNKILHGNLKPSNVLLDKNFNPKICDFLQCQKLSEIKSSSQIYLAPEILKGEVGGNASDVYSFGIIAYELVTGSLPYPDISEINTNVLNQIIEGSLRPIFPSNFNANMKSLIERCWDPDYLKRPSFDEIFTKITQNVNDFQKDVDLNELNSYLKSLNENISMPAIKKNHFDEDDLKKIFHFYLSSDRVGGYFKFALGEAFSSGNSEIVNALFSLKLVDINTVYISLLFILMKFKIIFLFISFSTSILFNRISIFFVFNKIFNFYLSNFK